MVRHWPNTLLRYGVVILAVGIALLISTQIDLVTYRVPFAFFFAAVALASWYGGRQAGLMATILSVVAVEYYIVTPGDFFGFDAAGGVELATFLLVALLINALTAGFQQREILLQGSEINYRFLFENNPMVMWVFDLETLKFLAVNDAAVSHYGYSREEFLSMTIKDIRPEEDLPRLLKEVSSGDEDLKVVGIWRHRKKDGTVIDVEIASHKLHFEGRPARLILATDVTGRERAAARVRESEARLLKVFGNCPVAVVVNRLRDRSVVEINAEFTKLTGWAREDVVGRVPRDLGLFDEKTAGVMLSELEKDKVLIDREADITTRAGDKRTVLMGTVIVEMEGEPHAITTFVNITERTRAESARKATEARYRTLFEYAPDGILIADPNSYYLDANDAICRMLGYPRDELIGLHLSDIVAPQEVRYIDTALRVIKSTVEYHREWVFRRKDGSLFNVEVIATRMPDGNLLALVRNITQRKEAEQALLHSEGQLAGIIGSAMDGIITVDSDQRIVLFNAAAERIFLCSAKDAMGQPVGNFIPERFRERHRGHIKNYGETKFTRRATEEIGDVFGLRANGEEFPVEASISQIESYGQKFYTVILRDITQRKRAEEALTESEERYRDLVENAIDIIYTHDLEGRFTSVNKAAEKITGYTFEDALKLNLADTVAPEYRERAKQMIAEKLAGNKTTAYELEIVARDGRRITVEVNTRIIYENGAPVGVQGIARDITERKHLEDQLRQSQKMEAIGLLAGGIAHDFNNLLTAITGYSDLALKKLHADDPLSGNIREIRDAGHRAAALTGQLLAFSRKQVLKSRVLNLNFVITEMEKMLRRIVRESIEFQIVLDPELGNIKADRGQMEQVIMNLAVNARDAMLNGGRLNIETQNIYLDEDYVSQHIEIVPGPFVKVTVTDTGQGMDLETQRRIFEPFYTTKEVGRGSGLGLSTVYGIIKQSGGDITVYSEMEHGTTFKIYLPRVDENVPAVRQVVENEDHSGAETILLVEDEETVRNLAREILSELGYTVLEAANGKEALSICETYPDTIHMLLTDMIMPGMSGLELKDRVLVTHARIKQMFMSGYTDDSLTSGGMLDLDTAFIEKPFTPDALSRKVREVLDG